MFHVKQLDAKCGKMFPYITSHPSPGSTSSLYQMHNTEAGNCKQAFRPRSTPSPVRPLSLPPPLATIEVQPRRRDEYNNSPRRVHL